MVRLRVPGRAVHSRPCLAGTAGQGSSPPATRAQSRDPFHRWRVKVRRAFRVLDGDWCLDVLAVGFFFFFGVSFTHPQRNCFSVTKFPLIFTVMTSEFNTFKSTEFMESVEMLADVLLTCREIFQTIRSFDF